MGFRGPLIEEFSDPGDDSDDESEDEETRQLQEELRALEKEEEHLRRERKKEDLRRKVEEKKKTVSRLQGETKHSKHSSRGSAVEENANSPVKEKVDIKDLRKDKGLRAKDKKIMRMTGVDTFAESSSESVSSDSESGTEGRASSDDTARGRSKKKKSAKKSKRRSSASSDSSSESTDNLSKSKKKKSGILSRPSDHVKYRQKYPQAFLRFEHVNSKVSFEKLEFNLFVAGELEIIFSPSIKSVELKHIMYLNSSYDFTAVKNLYAAVLHDIEVGRKS